MTDIPPAETLPGLPLAERFLASYRQEEEDLEFLMRELDAGATVPVKDELATSAGVPHNAALDALMILRLFSAHATAGRPRMLPPTGAIGLITAARPSDSKRLKALVKTLNAELLSDANTPLHGLERLQLIRHTGAGASRMDTERFIEQVETAVLAGDPVIVFLSGTQPMTEELRSIVTVDLTLAPPDAIMLAALLSLLHRTAISPDALPAEGIEMLSELQLVQTVCAGSASEAVAHLHRICTQGRGAARVTLDQVYGQSESRDAFTQLIRDLDDWRRGTLPWEEVTSSFLLFGPPGTGKTRLASALAGSARIPFVMSSYSDCQKAGHQGDMLRELNAAGERAIAQAPCVFFLDEIDSFYARSGSINGYILGVVNGLLTLLDRLNQTPGVVVIAATNHPDTVDPAVIRAGRFDRRLPVGPLDRPGIRAMLQSELGKDVLSAADCCQLADQLSGATGADLAGLIREARTQARRAAAALSAQHVRDAADRLSPRPDPGLQRRIAVHEAGHMLAGHVFGLPSPKRAELRARAGFVTTERVDVLTPDRISSLVRTDLGGYAAEQVVFGTACSGSGGDASSDLAQATRRVVIAELSLGFGETLSWQPATTDLRQLSARQRARIEQQLQEALQDTIEALRARRVDLEQVAEALLRERELDRDRIAELLRDVPVAKAKATAPARTHRAAKPQLERESKPDTETRDCSTPA